MTLSIVETPVPLRTDAHGTVRVGGTRVTLDTVVAVFSQSASAEEIVHRYPSLDLADVYAVLGYYLRHSSDVDAYLDQQERQAAIVREQVKARFDQTGIRERLLARRVAQS